MDKRKTQKRNRRTKLKILAKKDKKTIKLQKQGGIRISEVKKEIGHKIQIFDTSKRAPARTQIDKKLKQREVIK